MSKYGNHIITYDGMTFDSKKEYSRYLELLMLQKAGLISNLERQVEFELIPAIKMSNGKTSRSCKYIADFVYNDDNNQRVVEDVKGFKAKEYLIKKKILLWRYGIEIYET